MNRLARIRCPGPEQRVKSFLDRETINRVTVVGASFIGLEMVEMFRNRVLEVDLVELMDQALPPLDPEMAQLIEEGLNQHDVTCHGLKSLSTTDGYLDQVKLQNGSMLVTDLVMMCIDVQPNTELAEDSGTDIGNSGGIRVNPLNANFKSGHLRRWGRGRTRTSG